MADELVTQVPNPDDQNSVALGNGFIRDNAQNNHHTNDKQNGTNSNQATGEAHSRSWCSRIFCCLSCKPSSHSNTSNKQIHTNYDSSKQAASSNSPTSRPLIPTNTNTNNNTTSHNNHLHQHDENTSGGSGIASLVTQVSQNQQTSLLNKLPLTATMMNTSNTNTMNRLPAPSKYLLPPLPAEDSHKKCLVLDLDETLVHSSFKPIPDADFVMTIELENVMHRVYVRKRPGVDHFMKVVGEKFEVIVFTASLAKYADPLLDILDKGKVVKGRLFREACVQHYGNYVKDLSHLGRRLEHTIIIDNSPFSYMFQPDNAIPISSWFHDKTDRQLYELLPFLDSIINVDDVCSILQRKRFQFAQQ